MTEVIENMTSITSASYFILLGLCTRHREATLKQAIQSVLDLEIPQGVRLELIVVDNTKEASAYSLVSHFANNSQLVIHYCHEPKHGISFARNRVLEFALDFSSIEKQPQAIAFFDDDAMLDSKWLSHLYRYYDYDKQKVGLSFILTGPQQSILPDGVPTWVKKTEFFKPMQFISGTRRPWAATHNVFFDISLIKEMGLRFDSDFALTGGEDQMFFMQAVQKGAVILWINEAIVREKVEKQRISYRWILKRNFRYSSQGFHIYTKLFSSWRKALVLSVTKGSLYLSYGLLLFVPLGMLAWFFSPYQHYTLKALAYISRGLGWFIGSLGFRYQEYS